MLQTTISHDRAAATRPLAALLQQLADVVAHLRTDQYRQNPVGVVTSSVGGHVRHCLDHVRALIDSLESGELDYDNRRRGTDIETSTAAACDAIGDLLTAIEAIDDGDLDRPLM